MQQKRSAKDLHRASHLPRPPWVRFLQQRHCRRTRGEREWVPMARTGSKSKKANVGGTDGRLTEPDGRPLFGCKVVGWNNLRSLDSYSQKGRPPRSAPKATACAAGAPCHSRCSLRGARSAGRWVVPVVRERGDRHGSMGLQGQGGHR